MNCTICPPFSTTTLIIFRIESNGASPIRLYPFILSASPSEIASLTSAHSVGSPTASPFSPSFASEQTAIAVASNFSSADERSTTVILFCVSVPVLSEQIICVQPSVSTAVSLRITALRFDILVTPIESTIVTTAASPSGTAATARLTATINVLSNALNVTLGTMRRISTANTTTHTPSTSTLKILLSWFSFFCRGVSSSFAAASAPAIFPISVSMPTAVTTATPRPYDTELPMYTIFFLSPSGTSFSPSAQSFSAHFVTGTLSPVNADSSAFRLAASISRQSAGTASPASSNTTSPTTRSSLLTVTGLPSRKTFEVAAVIF